MFKENNKRKNIILIYLFTSRFIKEMFIDKNHNFKIFNALNNNIF